MRHRIFLAINLPENVKKKLADFKSKWPDLPCRWTKAENLHITLVFLGSVSD
ncbi:MAG: RNA 2',3'-cyclic phosphodiesterase, partial [Candidatus Nealsonbacteria bacterium]|nr:RNA 2',3'-cyclic phosphodiesterase [Candidatus Nealsonbacteria bacterium]